MSVKYHSYSIQYLQSQLQHFNTTFSDYQSLQKNFKADQNSELADLLISSLAHDRSIKFNSLLYSAGIEIVILKLARY